MPRVEDVPGFAHSASLCRFILARAFRPDLADRSGRKTVTPTRFRSLSGKKVRRGLVAPNGLGRADQETRAARGIAPVSSATIDERPACIRAVRDGGSSARGDVRDARLADGDSGGPASCSRLSPDLCVSTDPTVDLSGSDSSQRWPAAAGCTTHPHGTSRMMRARCRGAASCSSPRWCVIWGFLPPIRSAVEEVSPARSSWREPHRGRVPAPDRVLRRRVQPSAALGSPAHFADRDSPSLVLSSGRAAHLELALRPADRGSPLVGAVIRGPTGTREQFGLPERGGLLLGLAGVAAIVV